MVGLVEVTDFSDREEIKMLCDRRELSEDGYGLGNLQPCVCLFYFRNKH